MPLRNMGDIGDEWKQIKFNLISQDCRRWRNVIFLVRMVYKRGETSQRNFIELKQERKLEI